MAGQGEWDVRRQPPSSPGLFPRIPVSGLMGGGREAVLVHGGTEYRLRLTSNGKLILTK
jgi:hemin uptake protein HemP